MITIFAVPREFKGEFDVIQRNGIKSWTILEPKCEVILFGNENGVAEFAKELDLIHIPELEVNEFKTPMLEDMIEKARKFSTNEILVMLNPDVILMDDFSRAVKKAFEVFKDKPFLMAGQRWNLDVKKPINFSDNNWKNELKAFLNKYGKKNEGASGMDYLVFPKSVRFSVKGVIMGRAGVDNSIFYQAKKQGIPTIDSTGVIDIIHQNHSKPQRGTDAYSVENKKNIEAMGGFSKLATLRDADLIMTNNGIKKPSFFISIIKRIMFSEFFRKVLAIRRSAKLNK